jgi:hypothetical protein
MVQDVKVGSCVLRLREFELLILLGFGQFFTLLCKLCLDAIGILLGPRHKFESLSWTQALECAALTLMQTGTHCVETVMKGLHCQARSSGGVSL